MYINCDICGKQVKRIGLGAHKYRAHNPDYKNPCTGVKRGPAWNRGLTVETDERVATSARTFKRRMLSGEIIHPNTGKHLTQITKDKISKYQLSDLNHRHPNSRTNISYYSSDDTLVNLQSFYELIVANQLDRNNILWSRPEPLRYIAIDGKTRRYFPDFYLIDYDLYLDPKNDYLITKDAFKINAVIEKNKVTVLVLNKNELTWESIIQKIL